MSVCICRAPSCGLERRVVPLATHGFLLPVSCFSQSSALRFNREPSWAHRDRAAPMSRARWRVWSGSSLQLPLATCYRFANALTLLHPA